jgi:hypothetical protein
VETASITWPYDKSWGFAFRDIARSTDVRTAIGAVVPKAGFGNKAPLLASSSVSWIVEGPLIAGCFLSIPFDYVTRSKIMSTSLNWFIVEQLPVVPVEGYERQFGTITANDLVRDHVLRLSYTAHDLTDFARDLGHVDSSGEVLPPFKWDETERRHLRARLDALYFILYGVTDPADVDHILSTFPIVERKDRAANQGVYLTRELIHWYMRALQAGDVARIAPEADLIAQANRRRAA